MAQLRAPGRSPLGSKTELPAKVVGCFFLFTGGIHLCIVAADPGFYRHFAHEALLPVISSAWSVPALAFLVPAALTHGQRHWHRPQSRQEAGAP